MLMEAGQAASQAVGSGAYITGTFVIDGAILLAVLKVVEYAIGKIKPKNGNGKHGPSPGLADECLKHRDDIIDLKGNMTRLKDDVGEVKRDVKEILGRMPR